MKKTVFILFFAINTLAVFSQDNPTPANFITQNAYNNVVYKLFPTTNIWTFLKLNTRNGKIWQVQFAINDDDKRFETSLNPIALVDVSKEKDGRFILYATQNMWTFILLDQIDGKMWQVQWSLKAENRGLIPIYSSLF